MYHGEVFLEEEELDTFLKTAEDLKVRSIYHLYFNISCPSIFKQIEIQYLYRFKVCVTLVGVQTKDPA